MLGERFGRLVVLQRVANAPNYQSRWLCQCDCGETKEIRGDTLRGGKSRSCGCFHRDRLSVAKTIHGQAGTNLTPEYTAWQGMRVRCSDKKSAGYKNYGGRGVTVCDEWELFENFFGDMGFRPSPDHSLDRIDNNGNYCKSNCRWATREEQCRNKRNNRVTYLDGVRFSTRQELSALYGIHYDTLRHRLRKGWSVEEAIKTPIMNRGRRCLK